MEGKEPKKVLYIVLSKDKINNLENYWGEVEFKLNIIDTKTKKEIKTNLQNNINGIIGVLKKYTENKKINEEDKIQLYKELNEQLNEFNKCIEKINSETRGFKNIKEVVEGFKVKYYDAVGIKEKENNAVENGIGLFELFEVKKKVEETNEQSMKSSSSTSTETGSSTSIGSNAKTDSDTLTDNSKTKQGKKQIIKEELFKEAYNATLYKTIIDIDQSKCLQYLEQKNYTQQALEDIILNEKFKDNCLLGQYDKSKIDNIFIKPFFYKSNT